MRIISRIFATVLGLSIIGATSPLSAATNIDTKIAVLRGLDKITGRVTTIEAPVGSTVKFGSLSIIVRSCRKTPPTETPESAAFLDITDIKPNTPPVDVFRGWMFASSPAVSAMDHPVYDIWVLECRGIKRHKDKTANPEETG